MRMKIARNVLWLVFERGLQVAFGIVTTGLIARAVGPEGFAEFQYAQSLVLIAASIALICGGEVVVPRLVAQSTPDAQHRLLAHVFVLRETAAVVGYLLLVLTITMAEADSVIVLTAIIMGIPMLFYEPFGAVRAWLQARTESRPVVIYGLMGLALRMIAVAALCLAGSDSAPAFAWAFAAESLLCALLLARYYRQRIPCVAVQLDRQLAGNLLRDGAVFWVSMILMLCTKRVDQLLLKPQVSLFELGGYSASMQVLENFMMVSALIASAVAPLMIYAQQDLAMVRRNVLYVTVGMAAVGVAGGAVLALCAPWIIALIYGAPYETAANLLRLSAMASGLVFADAALSLLVIYMRKPNWLVEKWLLVLFTIVAVDLMMIPNYGPRGAVYGYIAGSTVAVIAGIGFFIRSREPIAVGQAA